MYVSIKQIRYAQEQKYNNAYYVIILLSHMYINDNYAMFAYIMD